VIGLLHRFVPEYRSASAPLEAAPARAARTV
jgi:hypothetical protein